MNRFILALLLLACSCAYTPPSIRYVAQQDPTDCGKACLVMLGYDGYGRDSWMTSPDILSRACGVREITPGSESAEREPHMLVVDLQNGAQHWILAYGNHVYDPAIGYRSIDVQYWKNNPLVVKREFVVPFEKVRSK